MIVYLAMHSALTTYNILGCPGILANVQGEIGAPYRDMTQIAGMNMSILMCMHKNKT